ncbi:MAG: hypothetical protein AABZ31_11400 [Bdellovibrionota bacterium]
MKKLMVLALFITSSVGFAADESCYVKSTQSSVALPGVLCLTPSENGFLLSVDGKEYKAAHSFSRKDAVGRQEIVIQISVQDEGSCSTYRESVLIIAGSLARGEAFITPDWCHSENELVESAQYQKVK